MPHKTVRIIGPTFGLESVFPEYGYTPITDDDQREKPEGVYDFICWTGGVDISPDLYGAPKHSRTQFPNLQRDKREIEFWQRNRGAKKLGICRGAQLLHVLNGGVLFQHVDNHNSGPHLVNDYRDRTVKVCSVHHQMMLPTKEGRLIAWASNVSTHRALDNERHENGPTTLEPEVIFYEQDKALCFQAHPEFGPQSCTDYFFQLIEELY